MKNEGFFKKMEQKLNKLTKDMNFEKVKANW